MLLRLSATIFVLPVVMPWACSARAQQNSTSPLIRAIKTADLALVQSLLKQGVDFKSRDPDGNTALMLATLYSSPEMMKLFLDLGADPNEMNKAGATALMWAVDDLDKVKLLVNRGANVNAQADVTQSGFSPLMVAANSAAAAPVVRFLLKRGADVNFAKKTGFTPLMAAMAGDGLGAIEVYHTDHRPADVAQYLGLAREFNLGVTGGSNACKPPCVFPNS